MVTVTRTSKARAAMRSSRKSKAARSQPLDRAFIDRMQTRSSADEGLTETQLDKADALVDILSGNGLGTIPAHGDPTVHVLLLPLGESPVLLAGGFNELAHDLVASHDRLEDMPLPALDAHEFAAAVTGLSTPAFAALFGDMSQCDRPYRDVRALLRSPSVFSMIGADGMGAFEFEPHPPRNDMAGVYRTLARGADQETAGMLAILAGDGGDDLAGDTSGLQRTLSRGRRS